ncbi:hypothetical protein DRO31_03180 [Candidatus Bathyarchaeota archaeon]|nr:MAG: hypothetical protein DRO31_03180 [Candidatus Bathyarchaeota archaeon]
MVYAVLVLEEAESQPFPVWPFILLSFFMGGFIYLVYFGLREPSRVLRPQINLQKRVETRKNMILLSLVGLLLVFRPMGWFMVTGVDILLVFRPMGWFTL